MPRTILRTALLLVLLTIPLSGCKTELFSHVCPPLQSYSKSFLDALAKEYADIITKYPHVAQIIVDYNITRDDIRACIKRNTPNQP